MGGHEPGLHPRLFTPLDSWLDWSNVLSWGQASEQQHILHDLRCQGRSVFVVWKKILGTNDPTQPVGSFLLLLHIVFSCRV